MSGIHPAANLAVSRILVDFRDDLGNRKTISGTGFWLVERYATYFITNRHCVDPTLGLGPSTSYRIEALRVLLREQEGVDRWLPNTEFALVDNLATCLNCHPSADVAVLKQPEYSSMFGHSYFSIEELATEEFLSEVMHPMDVASFFGYPGQDGSEWWDTEWNVAIARTAYLSSWPGIPFRNASVPTSDVTVVNGLSFSGSSGSPILSHQKPQPLGAPFSPPRILGIMSGHWWDNAADRPMFAHSGFSYFTRATAIREVL